MDSLRARAFYEAVHRPIRQLDLSGKMSSGIMSEIFEENVFRIEKSQDIPLKAKKEFKKIIQQHQPLTYELASVIAKAVVSWSTTRGATHFCHWFQPLTGTTAEKHDAFLDFDEDLVIEKLSASQLMKGEPDASSFPHGGTRSTFEARGYTAWDMSSPMFLVEGVNGKVLYIPCGFVTYHGDALDQKTPLLRSLAPLSAEALRFLHLTGSPESKEVNVNLGVEQEYFLIDKAFYFQRPDLVMTGRTLFGNLPAKNQQMEDHYFGSVEERVLSFMQELDYELYRLGIPAKTRHNEVAPGQFEIAPIFRNANIAADHNQLVMAYIKKVAQKHQFVAILHEKPFAKINGSGKHVNWSLSDNLGQNLLAPGDNPHENIRFLGFLAVVFLAFHRHQSMIRLSIASAANDHRLGGHEAPPSIMSIFIGEDLQNIFEAIAQKVSFTPEDRLFLDLKTKHLVSLLKDNTDRNRTSPFAFTGNKFEFRGVGSSAAIGWPVCILNAAVSEVLKESNDRLEGEVARGKAIDEALEELIRDYYKESQQVIFNGDGYSKEWTLEAQRRGLPHVRNSVESLETMKKPHACDFLIKQNIFSQNEILSRFNVGIERYNKQIEIEYKVLKQLIEQSILPACFEYKKTLLSLIKDQQSLNIVATLELRLLVQLNQWFEKLNTHLQKLDDFMGKWRDLDGEVMASHIVKDILPLGQDLVFVCNQLEALIPDSLWTLPKYYEMLFIK